MNYGNKKVKINIEKKTTYLILITLVTINYITRLLSDSECYLEEENKMKNIVFTRIDERLIHGQVITSWIKVNDINTIVVVDDATATNTFAKRILFAAAPKSITLKVFKLDEAIEYLLGEHEEEKIMLMTKVPHPILELLNAGVEIKEVNLGNMGGAAGRKRFNLNVNASDAEVQDFKDIIAKGTDMYAQMVPSDKKIELTKLL